MNIINIFSACMLAVALLAGCTRSDIDRNDWDDRIPEGYGKLNINLFAITGKEFVTRANSDPLLYHIDNVHLLIFEDTNGDGQITDDAPVFIRDYYQYGVIQNIYLKKGQTYYVYVVANLDDSNSPNRSVATFFDDVETYGDLRNKHVQFQGRTAAQVGKMLMATPSIIPIILPENSTTFTPNIPLQRLQSKFIINIYNRVTSATNRTVLSGVYPSMLSMVDMPRSSYIMERKPQDHVDGEHDFPFTLGDVSTGYYETNYDFLPDVGKVIEHPDRPGQWYTQQTIEFFCFENRRGSKPEINDYGSQNDNVPNVYGRKTLAPDYSTYLKLASLTEGNTLITYVHAGKGRDQEPTSQPDDITNFDVDRSCIYHFNIYINGVSDVEVDTRREYIDQIVIFTLPNDARVDAHYVDLPTYILGTVPGFAKLQSGICELENDEIVYNSETHEPEGWTIMRDDDPDEERWLRFSWRDPYRPTPGQPANTSLYVEMTEVDGLTGATPILHFNENLEDLHIQKAGVPAIDPSRRTAVVRIGFVPHAESALEYERGVLEGREASFFVPVRQYGLKTIGQVGGYTDGHYSMRLGVESIEEYTQQYYTTGNNQDVITNGIYWRYRDGLVNHNQTYDGLRATKDHYDEYRNMYASSTPPRRGQAAHDGTVYDPKTNTNAADYCMRKNRDENGDGIISGDEIKWYLPTPVQMMQMFTWRDAFRYGLNEGYRPFGGSSESRYYWTVNEENATQALALDFIREDEGLYVEPYNKTNRYPVRCVRDIPGVDESMFYYTNGVMVADLGVDNFPNLVDSKTGKPLNELRKPGNNTLARKFIISRWYVTDRGGANHAGSPAMLNQKDQCDDYSEAAYPGALWILPSQNEVSFLYAYAGMINNVFEDEFGENNEGEGTYHKIRNMTSPALHWSSTNMGHNDELWYVDFISGNARSVKKSHYTAFHRCITYIDNPPPRP